jgi:OsmC-like protein
MMLSIGVPAPEAVPSQEDLAMEGHTWTLRVCAMGGEQATVFARQHQFRVGAPVNFDRTDGAVSALEYVLGALGSDLVNGLQILARKRRVVIEQLEAVVVGELNNPLTYLGVIGETGHPGMEQVCIRVYLASPEQETTIQRLWQEMLERSPLVHTFQAAIKLELSLQVIV